jgi:hypothetical protein
VDQGNYKQGCKQALPCMLIKSFQAVYQLPVCIGSLPRALFCLLCIQRRRRQGIVKEGITNGAQLTSVAIIRKPQISRQQSSQLCLNACGIHQRIPVCCSVDHVSLQVQQQVKPTCALCYKLCLSGSAGALSRKPTLVHLDAAGMSGQYCALCKHPARFHDS